MNTLDSYMRFARIVSSNKRSRNALESLMPWDTDSRMGVFLEGLLDGVFSSDEDAELKIYGKVQDKSKYSVLKSRLLDTLCNSFLLTDLFNSDHSTVRIQYFEAYKLQACATLLILKGEHKAASLLLKRLLKKAKKFGLTDLAVFCCLHLRHISILNHNRTDYKKYRSQLEYFREVRTYESESYDAFHELRMIYSERSYISIDELRYFEGLERKMIEWKEKFSTPILSEHCFKFSIYLAEKGKNPEKLKSKCTDYIEWLELKNNKHLRTRLKFARLHFYCLWASYQQRNCEESMLHGKRALMLFNKGTDDWFMTIETLLLSCLQGGQYKLAFNYFRKAIDSTNFKKLSQLKRESWKVYELYLRYLLPEAHDGSIWPAKFDLSRFTKQVPSLKTDKPGYFAMIWVVSLLFLFKEKDTQSLLDRIDSFYCFCTNNKIKDHNPRVHFFSRAMRVIVNNNFNLNSVELAKIHFDENLANIRHHGFIESAEIIPFEEVFSFLDKDVKSMHKSDLFIVPVDVVNSQKHAGNDKIAISKPKAG